MWSDAVDLRDFYDTTLGQVARRMIRLRIRPVWPDVTGLSVLGLGYATPFLQPFRAEAGHLVAAMPASQGVLHWPDGGAGLTALVDVADLPFDDLSIDRVLLVHALEHAEQVRPLLREVWRVMSGSGRLLIVAPNRRGLWARFESTPFCQGRPYTTGQLSRLLRECMFTPARSTAALYVPPTRLAHGAVLGAGLGAHRALRADRLRRGHRRRGDEADLRRPRRAHTPETGLHPVPQPAQGRRHQLAQGMGLRS